MGDAWPGNVQLHSFILPLGAACWPVLEATGREFIIPFLIRSPIVISTCAREGLLVDRGSDAITSNVALVAR